MTAKTPAKGTTAKHARTAKAHRASAKHSPGKHKKPVASGHAHHVHTAAKPAAGAKPRGLALDGLPVCSLEAVAMSLRLAGQPVAGDEVAWLWELADGRELSIGEALEAAARFGLAGCRPVLWPVAGGQLDAPDRGELGQRPEAGRMAVDHHGHRGILGRLADDLPVLGHGGRVGQDLLGRDAAQFHALHDLGLDSLLVHGLILGVDRPGPHAVLATPRGWWSWGQLRDPWPCAIEEAWEVAWRA